jgi:predicted DNA-binding protein YlxM (UPF0122 family)
MHATKLRKASRAAIVDKIRRGLGILTQQEAELAYVSEAKDRVDLELRLREFDRSHRPFSSYPGYSWKSGF